MLSEEMLLEIYAASDEAQRLSMYLTYRDLRGPFNQIDMASSNRAEQSPIRHQSLLGPWLKKPGLAAFCRGWFRHCRPIK